MSGIGVTEVLHIFLSTARHPGRRRRVAVPGTTLRVLDDTGNEVPVSGTRARCVR